MSDRTLKAYYSLSCEELRLSVEFSLSPNVYGRIGSSPDMEISLPLVGLADEECRLGMDGSGLLWLTRDLDDPPIRIDPPAYFHAGPYRFLMREIPPSDPLAAGIGNSEIEADSKSPQSFVLYRRAGSIVATTVGLLVLAGVYWLATRHPDKSMLGDKTTTLAEKTAERDPAPTSPAPEEEQKIQDSVGQVTKEQVPPGSKVGLENNPLVRPRLERIDLEELATEVGPCVFLIEVSDTTGAKVGTGTGFSVSSDGLVATNYHVIEDGQTFSIVTNQGARFDQARVVVEDPAADLALLKIDGKGLPFLTLAKTSDVPVGKRVAALGSPEGLAGSLSEGIVSAPPRNLREKFPGRTLPNQGVLIQTTADISPGSSGSPLFDEEGRVLGVMTMIFRGEGDAQNLNFAVPVEALKPLIGKPKSEWLAFGLRSGDSAASARRDEDKSAVDPLFDPETDELLEKINAEEWVESMKLAGELVEKYPESAFAHFKHGFCASKLRLDQQAELSYRKVVEIDPDDCGAWNNLGIAIRNQKHYPEALIALEKSVTLRPDFALGWDNLVITNAIMKNWGKAAKALEALSKLDLKSAKETARTLSRLRLPNEDFRRSLEDTLSKKVSRPAGDGDPVYRVTGVSAGDVLSVRSGPGANFPKIDGIANDSEVFVVGEPQMNGATEWLHIEYGNFSGWVATKFLEAIE